MLVLSVVVLGISWVGAYYLAPSLLKTSNGPDGKTHPSNGNQTESGSIESADVLVDFGNGTRLWFNTTVPHDWNYYNVIYKVTGGDISARWFGYPIQSHSIYKILGFGCDPDRIGCDGYWSLWVWNSSQSCWAYSNQGVDWLTVSDVRAIAWYFNNYDTSSFPTRCD